MRLVLASARHVVMAIAVGLACAGLAACPTPQSPKGPPPLYEEPPAPSWLDGGAAAEGGAAAADGGGTGADGQAPSASLP